MKSFDDDLILFAEESLENDGNTHMGVWKVLVVDDDQLVHNTTKLVLSDFVFEGKKTALLHAHNSDEAKRMLKEHHDIAVVFLDVVMETEDSGLRMVQYIRKDLKNHLIRIILRTGQPGQAPEERVIVEYDINDYKTKTELTVQKLYTSLITALRSYRDLVKIERNRKGLKHIITSSSTLFEVTSIKRFTYGLLTQLSALFEHGEEAYYHRTSGFAAVNQGDKLTIVAANGEFCNYIDQAAEDVLPYRMLNLMKQASREHRSLIGSDYFVGFYRSLGSIENFIIFDHLYLKDDIDRELLELFSSNISVAFDNVYLNQKVQSTQNELILRLGAVVEGKSNELGNHVKRVSEYAQVMSRLLGLSDDKCQMVKLTAPLHDIGKIGIAEYILNKPGRLTAEEFEVIKKHTTMGYDILASSDLDLIQAAAQIALNHHENWDGSGYPRGLSKEQIPIESRIVAFVDVFDSLSERRVYKEAWSLETIYEFMKAESGKKFDPKIVELFFSNIQMFLEIKSKYCDPPTED